MLRRLSQENIKRIINYHYTGGDSSLVYKNILSPFAQFLIDNCVPLNIGENSHNLAYVLLLLASFNTVLLHLYSSKCYYFEWADSNSYM